MQFDNLETEQNDKGLYLTQSYSSISRRFAALIIDGLIMIIPGAILASTLPIIGGAIVWFFYAPILEASVLRATIGKHLMGIQVTDLQGHRLSLQASTVRNVLKLVSGAVLLIGFIFALFTKRKQALHDIVAETIVVYGRSDENVADAWVEGVKGTFRSAQEAAKPLMSHTSASTPQSKLDQLERLQKLRDQGTLTEVEFQTQKAKILDDRF